MKHIATQTLIAITLFTLLTAILVQTAHADIGNLTVTNLAGPGFTFTPSQLQAMPKTTVNADLWCYGSLVETGNWSGIQLSYLLSQTQVTPEVLSLQFDASDGYRVFIPISLASNPQVIIAYELNGNTLAEGPRLVLPEYNGAAWIAKITAITMTTQTAEYPLGLTARLPTAGLAPAPENTQSTPTPQSTAQPKQATPTTTVLPTPSSTVINDTADQQIKTQIQNDAGIASKSLILISVVLVAVVLGALGYTVYFRRKRVL